MKATYLIGIVTIFGLTGHLTAATPSFRGLGIPSGADRSSAYGVSDDGTIVTGYAGYPSGAEAFRWTQGTGMVGLGYPPGGTNSRGEAISADGTTIVGYAADGGGIAFRWTAGTGTEAVPLPAGWSSCEAYGVSGDGSVVVGVDGGGISQNEAWRWTPGGGGVGLGFAAGYTWESDAYGVSAEGSVVVGISWSDVSYKAFRWTQSTGMIGLAHPPGVSNSSAVDVSADGSTIVGSFATPVHEAFRWTPGSGMVSLGLLADHYASSAQAVSGDGSIVVGYCNSNAGGETAFIWDADNGIRNLEDALVNDCGLDLGGWSLSIAYDVSADGRFIVGYGRNASGDIEAFLAEVPEPATLILMAGGLPLLLQRKRKSRWC